MELPSLLTTHTPQKTLKIKQTIKRIDDQATLKQAEQVKEKVSQPAQNVSGTQTYQDPTKVQSNDDTTSNTYDASLDELNGSSSKTSQINRTIQLKLTNKLKMLT